MITLTQISELCGKDSRFSRFFDTYILTHIEFKDHVVKETTLEEKQVYGVNFKKSINPKIIRIDVAEHHEDGSNMILVLRGLKRQSIYFTDLEKCKEFVIEEVNKILKQEKIDNKN